MCLHDIVYAGLNNGDGYNLYYKAKQIHDMPKKFNLFNQACQVSRSDPLNECQTRDECMFDFKH